MRWLGGLFDRLVLLAAVLAAACIPGFIVQYRQRLGGRLDQIHADLAPFQAIADRNFGGSLSRLIQYHLASRDPTFHQEGAALQGMLDAAMRLQSALQALQTDLLHQCWYLAGHLDWGLARSTWGDWEPGFTLTAQSLVFALGVGVVIWLLFLTLWHGSAALGRSVSRSAAAPAHRAPPPRRAAGSEPGEWRGRR